MPQKREQQKVSKIIPGEWRAELLGAPSLHLGGETNLTPSPHAIEFSWLTVPTLARGPNKVGLAAVVVLMAPAEPVGHEYPGLMMASGLVTMIDLIGEGPSIFGSGWRRSEMVNIVLEYDSPLRK